jgi:hypothetical protein
MSTPADRFDTIKADGGTILADLKGAFGDLAQTIHDAVDAAKPEIVSALQHLELALHLISGVPETREPSTPPSAPQADLSHPAGDADPEPDAAPDDGDEFAPKSK